jgi:hypothetical protein
MTDLSQPPLNLVPLDHEVEPAAGAAPAPEPFAWPTPPLACYPQPMCALVPEPCEVEGLNGKTMPGRLAAFLPDDGQLQLQVPNMRAPLTLRLSQFKRLVLTHPLAPLPGTDCTDAASALDERPPLPYRLDMTDGAPVVGLTIGHLEDVIGLFLFEPVDAMGRVRRIFVPRHAYQRVEVGPRLGEVLLEHQITTPGEQSQMPMVRIGEALTSPGLHHRAQLERGPGAAAHDRGVPLGELLVRHGHGHARRPADRAGAQDGLSAGGRGAFRSSRRAAAPALPGGLARMRRCR